MFDLQLNHYVENNAGYSKILVAVLVLVAVYLASLDGFIEFVSIYEGFARNLEGVDLAFLDDSVESGASDPEVLTCLIKHFLHQIFKNDAENYQMRQKSTIFAVK